MTSYIVIKKESNNISSEKIFEIIENIKKDGFQLRSFYQNENSILFEILDDKNNKNRKKYEIITHSGFKLIN